MAQVENSGGYNTQKKCRVFKTKGASVSKTYAGHSGVDVTADGGFDYVVAHSLGTVVGVEKSRPWNAPGSAGMPSYGNYVKLKHANGFYTIYAHLSTVYVSMGQTVYKGQTIGFMGNSGNSYGAHLHFEVRNSGGYVLGYTAKNYLNADLPHLPGGGAYVQNGNPNAKPKPANSGGSGAGTASGSTSNTGNAASVLTGTASETPSRDITKVVVKSVSGNSGTRDKDLLSSIKKTGAAYEILIQNNGKVFSPVLVDNVTLEWQRKGAPGVLQFKTATTGLKLSEGDPVALRVNGSTVFYGYVFEKSQSDPYIVSVKVYDQLRYLKNKGTLAYADKTYTQVLQMLAKDYDLTCGILEDTKYKIPQRIEDGTLFDILGNASDETVMRAGKLFVLYDDCGKLTLKNVENMLLPLLVDADTTSSFKYATTIDRDVFTRITLASDNSETGERELYVYNNTEKQAQWGVLQYYESMSDASATKLRETAKLLSGYYGKLRRTLSLSGCLGDVRVRGGSSLVVRFQFGDFSVQNYMIVEKVKHTFANGLHTMDLDVSGVKGEFVA